MPPYRPPVVLPPTEQDRAAEKAARAGELRRLVDRGAVRIVRGPRRQLLTVGDAQERADALQTVLDLEEEGGSVRHRPAARLHKLLALAVVSLVDLPVMLWVTVGVFNVDLTLPAANNLPLWISVVVAVLATAGVTATLQHLGHDLRQHKNARRHLDVVALPLSSKLALVGMTLLVVAVALLAFARVYTEGVLSGADGLGTLLAVLVALVMLISAWLVFWTAFADGSPEGDDLVHYGKVIRPHLVAGQRWEDEADRLERESILLTDRDRRNTARLETVWIERADRRRRGALGAGGADPDKRE